jgi:hypothetical protein
MATVDVTGNGDLMTACAQPTCTGTIVDGYCDVCGSPAGAAPFVPAEASACAQPGCTGTIVDGYCDVCGSPADAALFEPSADPGAAEPNGAHDYRKRVEEAQLPDGVRETALREVAKLERTSDQSPEARDIQTWLDTILDLPWSTKTTDWIDIQESGEVEATLRRLIEPAVANVEEDDTAEVEAAEIEPVVAAVESDTAEVEPVVAAPEGGDAAEVEAPAVDVEHADRAPAGPHGDDTLETTAVVAVPSAGGHPGPRLPEQGVVGPVLVHNPAEKRRVRSLALAASALVALLIGALFVAASRDGSVTGQSPRTVTGTPTATVSTPTIQLEDLAASAMPLQAVRIRGTYRGGADTFLRVQRWEGGNWVDFPLTPKTNQSGQFTAYVELWDPGRYRLRVLDPDSGVTSKTFVLLIKG